MSLYAECKRGHELTGSNLRITKRGERLCVTCRNILAADYRARRAKPARVGPSPSQLENYIPVPESGCWLWLGPVQTNGYGRIWLGDGYGTASREIYMHHKGALPYWKIAHVLHKCDTPLCVNPDHMFVGDQRDNVRDMHSKNRHPCKSAEWWKVRRSPITGQNTPLNPGGSRE